MIALEAQSEHYLFGIPGVETLDLIAALQSSNVEFIITRYGQGATFKVATLGRLTGQPGICLTTLGLGALNTMTAIAFTYLGQMPMLVITG